MPPGPFTIRPADQGRTLASFLQRHCAVNHAEACAWVRGGKVSIDGKPCKNPQRLLRKGQRLHLHGRPSRSRPSPEVRKSRKKNQPAEPKAAPHAPRIRFLDEHIAVVDKPAGLTTVRHAEEMAEFGRRARRYLPPTLADTLPELLAREEQLHRPPRVYAVHRLDRDTSGLVVFALTKQAESRLGKQFRAHNLGRKYVALVRGRAQSQRLESHLVRDRGDGRRGSTDQPGQGKLAITHVRLLEDLCHYSQIECTLETGRTHQIRIHLGEQGTPLCGERVYDRPLHGRPLPDGSGAARPLLHAGFLEIEHPVTGKRLSWDAPMPKDMKTLLRKLRQRRADQSPPGG
jgi:23S rRNA pseudouridine1911/1915/1917 synthase